LENTGQILVQLYVVVYLTWFYNLTYILESYVIKYKIVSKFDLLFSRYRQFSVKVKGQG